MPVAEVKQKQDVPPQGLFFVYVMHWTVHEHNFEPCLAGN